MKIDYAIFYACYCILFLLFCFLKITIAPKNTISENPKKAIDGNNILSLESSFSPASRLVFVMK